MRVAIVGSRGYPDPTAVKLAVSQLWGWAQRTRADLVIVSGGADGPDTIAAIDARRLGLQVFEHLPNYKRDGRRAPLARNTFIVNDCDRVIAFWDGKSRGTLDTIRKAVQAGKPVKIVPAPVIKGEP